MASLDSFNCERTLDVRGGTYTYYDLKEAEKNGLKNISKLPRSLKVLLENLLRHEDGNTVKKEDIQAIAAWLGPKTSTHEIAYRPARVLMQDFTGVPAVVDLAAMRDAMVKLGGSAEAINPLNPVHLVIDHSVMVDYFGTQQAFKKNVDREYERNGERYDFLKWGQKAFDNFSVVPPGTGICHQVNLENLAQTVWTKTEGGKTYAFPDTLVGTDSHTTMINGLSVLGWGVGGIEAEAAMLGQPISMLIPEVVGFELTGKMVEGSTATDLVLRVVEMLRQKGVVGKFVEFYGEGLDHLSLEDQATLANMAPEYGATCGFFPIDADTLKYLNATGRDEARIELVEAYAKAQGLWRDGSDAVYTDTVHLDMGTVKPALSGPKRPQDRFDLDGSSKTFAKILRDEYKKSPAEGSAIPVKGKDFSVDHGDVFIAAITSCTNTSNPSVMMAAGLVAQKANALGLTVKPWVKTSLAPGSQVVGEYLEKSKLQTELNKLGFDVVGYGCTTCIGNSGPLADELSAAIAEGDLVSCSVLSGNRNFEGRIGPDIKANFLASPPLVVAYALAGSMHHDFDVDPLGVDKDGNDVYLKDIWPSSSEIAEVVRKIITRKMFTERYADVFKGDKQWQKIKVTGGETYDWQPKSTYVRNPPYFDGMTTTPDAVEDVKGANILALLGDSITTDHISPAGAIKGDGPAGRYLTENNVVRAEFNSFGSRRGNHEVMMRGTFANIRIKNLMAPGTTGGVTKYVPTGEVMSIFDAAEKYKADNKDLVVFAGGLYGNGSSRDWAAKGTILLGVKAVIAESFERIHRSNLIGMGVLPLEFQEGESWEGLGLTGDETVDIENIDAITPRSTLDVMITSADGSKKSITVNVRIDTENELEYYRNGGILHYVLRNLAREAVAAE
ncbi:aconitate hydratase [Litorimonas taeanensis]|uniref:Aconitate hydratase n=1 Tax=Litorimonas taeanensis TaxID=568099 RepID=A0A420WEY3_9PROT|nr:aconitate hydratase AcnA [Litorimonas taeanensis]RKQ69548.1 aconitate hydratase [Litorimonas taeanensis]